MFKGRRIILGVTGSIAAYKAAEVARSLIKAQAEVIVVMTENAQRFITPLTFKTITRRPVATTLFADPADPVPHISLATWADLVLVAPATADCIARVAAGRADDLLAALILDTQAPVLWAPAMNTRMWENQATQSNVLRLTERGHRWIQPASGELACQETGKGRLAAVPEIMEALRKQLFPSDFWQEKKVLLTAGPTREAWDAIRFLSNRSTGKMGYALAAEARMRGAAVTLISGPVDIENPPGVDVVSVTTAREMHAAAMQAYADADIVIAAAAVADFRPASPVAEKIKKDEPMTTITLVPNPDILADMGRDKGNRLLVGFAAETRDPIAAGKAKRKKKNCDLIVANYASGPEDAFGSDKTKIYLVDRDDQVEEHRDKTKTELARLICDRIESLQRAQR